MTGQAELTATARDSAVPALLAAAAGVGFGHAILPDLDATGVVGRVERFSVRRVARLATLAGSPTCSCP